MKNLLPKKGIAFAVIALFIGTSVVSAGINVIEGGSISDREQLKYSENNRQFIDVTETTSFDEFDVYYTFSNGTYSYYRALNTSGSQSEKTGGDNYYVHGKTNKSFIVKVSSPYYISLENFRCNVHWNITTNNPTSSGRHIQCFLTDKTWMLPLMGMGGTGPETAGKFRYFHVKFGRFTYTYDNRTLYNGSGANWTDWISYPFTFPLSPGTWYFIFTAAFYDLSQEEVLESISVWMNLSGTDLEISTSEGGIVYALWYGEFDSNLLISKAGFFEMMLRGRTRFHINHTFLYNFPLDPNYQGFWRVKWITPDEVRKLTVITIKGKHYCNQDYNTSKCLWWFGESGEYELRMSYLDYVPDGDIPWARHPYFFGVDVELP